MATKHTSKCIKNAGDDEPLFVLRAQDYTSTATVLEWIKLNFETCPNDKLESAFKTALEMKDWCNRKIAD